MKLSSKQIAYFQDHIWTFYAQEGRLFPWRNIDDPYKILISEVMLQQTQTHRVIPKYEAFITTFPSFSLLAQATLREVLSLWQGLGYNRRGKYLHELANHVMNEFNGILPSSSEQLITLPGIGPATAASIAAFAFNRPTVFVETNIRTVFITHFFATEDAVHDKQLIPLVAQTVDRSNPREWYYALMDYGVMLKKTMSNPSRKSAHYARQSKFEGSDRQVRGKIIRMLTNHKTMILVDLYEQISIERERLESVLDGLVKDGLVKKNGQIFMIYS